VGAGVTITDGPNGVLQVRLAASDTDALDCPTTLLWDLQVSDGVNDPQTVAHGELVIEADISRTAP
jgi:hypothetical protein